MREVQNVMDWASKSCMTINITKTKELVVRVKVEWPLPSITCSTVQVFILVLSC